MGAKPQPCYKQICVITNHVIMKLQCSQWRRHASKVGGVQIDFEGGGVVDEVRKFEGGGS